MNLPLSSLPPIFVISLAKAVNRRIGIANRLDAAGVSYEVIDAVDGSALDLDSLSHRINRDEYRIKYGYELTPGIIGCYLSHYNLWQRIVNERIDCALVMEDDAIWDEDFFEVVLSLQKTNWYWEMINLSMPRCKVERVLYDINEKYRLVSHKRGARMTAAYIIRRSAAEKLLSYCYEIRAPIDIQGYEDWKIGIAFYLVCPAPVSQSGKDAQSKSMRLPRSLVEKIKGSIWRKVDRWSQSLHRRRHPPQEMKT